MRMDTDLATLTGFARAGAGVAYGNLSWNRDYGRCGNSSLRQKLSWRTFGVGATT